MKLAEALVNRADAQKRIEQIKQRMVKSAKVQEGENPPENPGDLIQELDRTLREFTDLVRRINKTNSGTAFQKDMTLTDALAERDALALKRNALNALIEAASVQIAHYSRSEIKSLSTIHVAEMQKQVDALAKEYRELDTKIQELNWQTELMDR